MPTTECWTMTLTLNYVCALGHWEEPSLSPGALKRTLSHFVVNIYVHKQSLGLMSIYPIISVLQQPQDSIMHALNSEHVLS